MLLPFTKKGFDPLLNIANDTKIMIKNVQKDPVLNGLAARQVERESERDPTLHLVRHAIISGDWSKLQGTTYKAVRDELWIMGQLVMSGNKVVMLEKLWNQTLNESRPSGRLSSHLIETIFIEKVWWPNLDKQVEKLITACYLCQLVGPRPKPEPIEWQILLRERCARRKLREKEYAFSKRHATTSDVMKGDLNLLLEKNGNAVVIENSAGQSKLRNAGHMKKFVDPGTEMGATETELPTPSVTTDIPKEGTISEQIQQPVGHSLGCQQDHFWDQVEVQVIRGDGPTTVASKPGYLLSGPMRTPPDQVSATAVNLLHTISSTRMEELKLEWFWSLEAIGICPQSERNDHEVFLQYYCKSSITGNEDVGCE
ncbi:hypothetical protein P5673_015342 [Acropora cervicornis]|uniref:Integrase zinc-binding domain-containing protein n=1 Tax=Acropora cervicornis TaxID=6130 RepID=A0AAD9QIK3_ACRCE|nr:hypothetical protein P5673_015342 [Acropora cervicornis]